MIKKNKPLKIWSIQKFIVPLWYKKSIMHDNSKSVVLLDGFRLKIDALIQSAGFCDVSEETKEAKKSLKLAKSWLGKAKGDLGQKSPYVPVSKVADIPPTAEKYKGEILHPKSHLEHINLLRKEIAGTIDTISKSMDSLIGTGIDVFKAIDLLREARFHYGFEIERLKNESDSVL